MRYEIILSPEAIQDLRSLKAHLRAAVRDAFETEEDWFDYRLEHDTRFLQRVTTARESLRAGQGTRLEDIETD